jgi:deoxyribose-phosphate aldolase
VVLQEGLAERVERRIAQVLPAFDGAPGPAAIVRVGASELAQVIDHTLLKAEATEEQIVALCEQAQEYGFAAVCVNPSYVGLCASLLQGTGVRVATVAGFPLGATLPEVKAYEAQRAIADGASEVDMVIHVGALRARAFERVYHDIATVVQAAHAREAVLKVIIEAALLTDQAKVAACYLAQLAGADYCKTSTGFGPGGALVRDVALMRQTIGPEMGLKAAGGIRSYHDALAMIAAGATRIGASSGVEIVRQARTEESR